MLLFLFDWFLQVTQPHLLILPWWMDSLLSCLTGSTHWCMSRMPWSRLLPDFFLLPFGCYSWALYFLILMLFSIILPFFNPIFPLWHFLLPAVHLIILLKLLTPLLHLPQDNLNTKQMFSPRIQHITIDKLIELHQSFSHLNNQISYTLLKFHHFR